ncbi:putative tautomerase [Thalassoglobus neptunius]|uniref:Tautomerase n=1 Tax=Thalassoglobus neptunius TaxID=1938619 RepID=A0A5C5VY11_9PLAN|nr:putative tautomerase [Thalassoglobus neptunius]
MWQESFAVELFLLSDTKGVLVPYINVQITSGATREQKSTLVREMTDSLVRVLSKKPEHIHIIIQEVDEENWGYAGLLTDDWKRQQTEG